MELSRHQLAAFRKSSADAATPANLGVDTDQFQALSIVSKSSNQRYVRGIRHPQLRQRLLGVLHSRLGPDKRNRLSDVPGEWKRLLQLCFPPLLAMHTGGEDPTPRGRKQRHADVRIVDEESFDAQGFKIETFCLRCVP
jgi:hypothetical protein